MNKELKAKIEKIINTEGTEGLERRAVATLKEARRLARIGRIMLDIALGEGITGNITEDIL